MIKKIISALDKNRPLYIMSHSYPDFDSIASAYALKWLLASKGISAELLYHGTIESPSLIDSIKRVKIELAEYDKKSNSPDDNCDFIVVDASYGNANIIKLPGRIVANIDHHDTKPSCGLISDIRPQYGACASIIAEYIRELSLRPSFDIANLLLTAIFIDTDFLKRKVSPHDLEAINFLSAYGDIGQAASVANNSLVISDIPVIKSALENVVFYDFMAFFFLDEELRQEVLAIIADTIIRLEEITLVVGICRHKEGYKVSVRSEDKSFSAGIFAKNILAGIGSGGGHINMGGGFIKKEAWPGKDFIYNRCVLSLRSK